MFQRKSCHNNIFAFTLCCSVAWATLEIHCISTNPSIQLCITKRHLTNLWSMCQRAKYNDTWYCFLCSALASLLSDLAGSTLLSDCLTRSLWMRTPSDLSTPIILQPLSGCLLWISIACWSRSASKRLLYLCLSPSSYTCDCTRPITSIWNGVRPVWRWSLLNKVFWLFIVWARLQLQFCYTLPHFESAASQRDGVHDVIRIDWWVSCMYISMLVI